jgi:hypothetical protein
MKRQSGFGIIEVIIIVVVLALIGAGGWYLWQNANKAQPAPNPTESTSDNTGSPASMALVTNAKNTQAKADLAAFANAVVSYVNDHSGSYPASDEDLAKVQADYLNSSQSFKSPLTEKPYELTFSSDYAKGVVSLVRGVCADNKTGVEPSSSPRQYSVLTMLINESVYCIDL